MTPGVQRLLFLFWDTCRQDVGYAVRSFARSPGFATTAVLSLAAGIGSATALFSVVYALLLNPFPYTAADRLVNLGMTDNGRPRALFANARQLGELQRSGVFDGAFALDIWSMTLTSDLPEAISTQYLSANGLAVLGVPPLIGRIFTDADGRPGEQPEKVVVLTYRFWRRHFGGRTDALGQTIQLNREPYRVIGVVPRQYFASGPEIIIPIHLTLEDGFAWGVQARLKPGISLPVAEARLQPLFEQFAKEAPHRFPKVVRVQLRTFVEARRGAGFVPTLILIFAAAVLLLLLACCNVSILLLARGTTRADEFAIRSAIGAPKGRLVAQLLIESLLLAGSGTTLGLIAGYWGVPAVLRSLPPNTLPPVDAPVSIPVLFFSAGVAVVSAMLFGLWPARSFLQRGVRALVPGAASRVIGGALSSRLHALLLAGQVGLTIVLLAGTGAAVRVLIGLYDTPLGYDPRAVLVALLNLPENSHTTWDDRAAFYERLRGELARTPQVGSVAFAVYGGVPPRTGGRSPVEIPGQNVLQGDAPVIQRIGPQYFGALKIPLVTGRVWSESENARAAHVAVVNETMARRVWPGQLAIGQRVRVPEFDKSSSQFVLAAPGSDGWFEVIGVVGDTPNMGLHEPTAPSMYVPYTLMLGDSVTMIIRTTRDPLEMTRSIREAVRTVDPSQPVNSVRTAEDVLATAGWARERFVTILLLGFAGFALVLAVVGLYSVVAYSVARRFKEFGIRMALGASRGHIVGASLRSAIVAAGAGLVAGLGASVALDHVIARWSVGDVSDPLVLVIASVVLIAVAAAAALIPANRAGSIDPTDALRIE